jgi:hypothetical protein
MYTQIQTLHPFVIKYEVAFRVAAQCILWRPVACLVEYLLLGEPQIRTLSSCIIAKYVAQLKWEHAAPYLIVCCLRMPTQC